MRGMDTADKPGPALIDQAVPEPIADLLDTMAGGDPDATADVLEGIARRLRKAAKAKHALARVPAASISAAFELRAKRREAKPCP